MGALCSAPALSERELEELEKEKAVTRTINDDLVKEQKHNESILKLLLLGTGESGKSTLFKQLTQLYGRPFTEEKRQAYASIVFTNVVTGMKTLIKNSDSLPPELHTRVNSALIGSKNAISELKADADVDANVARHINLLWADPGIRNTFEHRSRFQLSDSCRYFFERMDEISRPSYIPSYPDILQCRARTTGIVETSFRIDDNQFMILDVGGQRNERKKWIHCFENVTAVIFVAAINEYDQVLYEDGVTNRVAEALSLFEEMCNLRWFRDTAMMLFLNKRDLFAEKIQRVDMKLWFPSYTGGCLYDAGVEFLMREFVKRNEYPDRKQIYVHVTCATDTDNIRFTFNVAKDIIIKERLKECGLLQ